MEKDKLISIKEAAEHTGFSYPELLRLIDYGKIKSFTINIHKKTKINWVQEYIESQANLKKKRRLNQPINV